MLNGEEEFLSTRNFLVTPQQFHLVFDAIPTGSLMLFRNVIRPAPRPVFFPNPADCPVGKMCFSLHPQNGNTAIRVLFHRDVVSIPYVMAYWNQFVNYTYWKKVWMLPHKYPIMNKIKEVSFRIIHKYYPSSHCMQKFKRHKLLFL